MTNDKQLPAKPQQKALATLSLDKGSVLAQLTPVEFCKFAVQSGYFEGAGITDLSQALIKVAYGEKLGIDPLTALNSLYISKGKVSMEPAAIYDALCNHARYGCDIIELNDERATVQITFDGKPKGEPVTFTYEQACGLGFAGRNAVQWKHNKRNMMLYKAAAFAQRAYARDLFKVAVYGVDEIESEHDGALDAQIIEEPATKAVASAMATAEQKALQRQYGVKDVQQQTQPEQTILGETPTSTPAEAVDAVEAEPVDPAPAPAEDLGRQITPAELGEFADYGAKFGYTPGALTMLGKKTLNVLNLQALTLGQMLDLREHIKANPR